MIDLNKKLDVSDVIYGLLNETKDETANRRKENAERREECQSELQEEMSDKGLCESDYL